MNGAFSNSLGTLSNTNNLVIVENCIPAPNAPYGTAVASAVDIELYSYLRLAFLGMRGGMRKRVRLAAGLSVDPHSYVNVSLLPESTSVSTGKTITAITTLALWTTNCTTLQGTVTFDQASNGGIEFEVPFYSRNLFHFAFASDGVGSNPGTNNNMDTTWYRGYQIVANLNAGTYTNQGVGYSVEQATGEDFCFMRFTGAPCSTF